MRTDRTPMCRMIDFSGPLTFDGSAALKRRIVDYIKGVRGPRRQPVTKKQIIAWFRSTPSEFVEAHLGELLDAGKVRICRTSLGGVRIRHNARYVYEVSE